MVEKNQLINDWFPFGEAGVESKRERAASSAFPPINYLHIWFARKPLITSRSSIICSVLQNKDKKNIFKILGIPNDKDIVSLQKKIEEDKAKGIRKKENPYTWDRAFKHTPSDSEFEWLHKELKKVWGGKLPTVLDPMAGGGSIPFEALRLGLPTIASDLNPVSFLILKSTLEYPVKFGDKLIPAVEEFCNEVQKRAYEELKEFFPHIENEKITQYLWCRTIKCEKCGLMVPLSRSWWLLKEDDVEKQIAARLIIPKESEGDICSFEIIKNPSKIGYDPDEGTDVKREGICPRCPRTILGDFVKKEAQEGRMGHQLYCVNAKQTVGLRKQEWNFRVPTKDEIDSIKNVENVLETRLPFWLKKGIAPDTDIPYGEKGREALNFGMKKWIDMFNPRQKFTHLTYLEKLLQVKKEWMNDKKKDKDFVEAILVYAGIVFDNCITYNCLFSRWAPTYGRVNNGMVLQAFPFMTSNAEWNQLGPMKHGGFNWSISKTLKSVKEIIKFVPRESNLKIFCEDSAKLRFDEKSIEAIVIDPPYHENVLYGEISDFFYVWLKKTVGDLFPNEFKNELSDKDSEAVANSALYREAGRGQAKKLAYHHFQAKIEACFKDMNRVLKDDGILTVMFTHKKSEAWAGLTKSLMNAGFTFRSSWAVKTERGTKFAKTNKGVLSRTVILACVKRTQEKKGLWSKVKEELYNEAKSKVAEYSKEGITGPDLLVCTYGPVLGKFGDYSLIKDSAGNTKGPEDALDLVAEVVNKFTTNIPGADLETMAYVNLISSFSKSTIDYDDARVTVMFGGNLSISDLIDKGLVVKEGKKVTMLTSKQRLDSGVIDSSKPENLKSLIDVVHTCLVIFEKLGIKAVKKLLEDTGKDSSDSGFIATLKAISSVGFDVEGKSPMFDEIKTVNSLLEALGLEPESVLKKGEKLTHYPNEAKLDDF